MNVGSLFSGIGGIDLGLERAGMRVVWQCESDPYARAVLRKHWPDVPCYEDVSRLRGSAVAPVDLLAGGFPCQDISAAGLGAGLGGERSGLWFHFARIIGETRPQYAIIESTPPFRRWVPVVRRHLRSAGYASLPIQLRAADFGAPHLRNRIFVLAYADREGELQPGWLIADIRRRPADSIDSAAADTDGAGLPLSRDPGAIRHSEGDLQARPALAGRGRWTTEPDVVRMVHGIPSRVDRIRCLGNAVVPQVAEWLGRLILSHARAERP